jgi:hypothetical protein
MKPHTLGRVGSRESRSHGAYEIWLQASRDAPNVSTHLLAGENGRSAVALWGNSAWHSCACPV